jgi:hypothetical protein
MHQISSSSRFAPARISRINARASAAAALRKPCLVFAARIRSSPSGVRGPVDRPPCIRQRPFFIPATRQGVPLRVRAPQHGAVLAPPNIGPEFGCMRSSARVLILCCPHPGERCRRPPEHLVLRRRAQRVRFVTCPARVFRARASIMSVVHLARFAASRR